MPRHINALIPAAGLSSRMGEFKPLLPLGGRTVIESTAESLLDGGAELIVVVLGHRGAEVESVLRVRFAGRVIPVYNPDPAGSDMLSSVKLGLAAMPPCDAFFLLPGDMPAVSPETCRAVRRAFPEDTRCAVFPTTADRRGHPPLIGWDLRQDILTYDGPDGLRGFWQTQTAPILTVPVEDGGCHTDLDTPDQYQAMLKRFSEISK